MVAAALIGVGGFFAFSGGVDMPDEPSKSDGVVVVNGTPMKLADVELEPFVIQQGDYLAKIARQPGLNMPLDDLVEINEDVLAPVATYEGKCGELSVSYRKNPRRNGHFCNDGLESPWANTLVAGEVVYVPAGFGSAGSSAISPDIAREVNRSVSQIQGEKIVLVVDDTGSTEDDRVAISNLYQQLLGSGRVIRVVTYADGDVRDFRPGNVQYQHTGGTENTRAALLHAKTFGADHIVLISDEPGDDWGGRITAMGLPPVTAHCLRSDYGHECEVTLNDLAKATGGEYIAG